AGVRLLRRRVAGVLAHGPAPGAVHLRVDPPGEGILARLAEPLVEIEVGHVRFVIDGLDLDSRVREAPGIVRADVRSDAWMARVDAPVARLYICRSGLGVLLDRPRRHSG